MQQASSTSPNPLDSSGLCLLSLDGGGVRGLSTLYILKGIMDRLKHERKQTANVKPCEVFDLIGGTSTGGLIAIMLGRLEMDVDECIAAYIDLAASVFGEKRSRIPFNIKGKVQQRFDSAKLEAAIRKVVVRSGGLEKALLNDGTERGCRTFVCTADCDTKDIVRLRSYSLPDEPNIPATICQAARATSAATTFFDPIRIGDRSFADGGLGANNPVDEVEGEAANIWCSGTGDLKPLVKCFISIGTGNPGKKAFEDSIVKFLGQTVVNIATETENTEKKFVARWAKHFDEKRYFRFNIDQGLQGIGLDEYKKKGAMEAATAAYLTHTAQKFRVRDCIQNLRLKQNKTNTSFAAVMNEYTKSSMQQQPVHEASWIVPFERNGRFIGRETELAQLEGKIFVEDGTTKIAITGLGGVGKTQLLLELVYKTRKKYENCSIIWIAAINMESVQQAYLDVARQLRIPGWEADKVDVKRLVKEYLSKESAGQWLLVFDNADDIDMWIDRTDQESDPLIEYLPRSIQGCIVFTTRDRKAAVKLAHQNIVEVLQMNESAATQLLQRCLVNQDLIKNERDTKALLEQLTCLPLAIVQAAAYINANGITLAKYLSLLEEQEDDVIDLLSEEFEDEGRYRSAKNPIATTWLISFEQIRHRDPLAAEYLSFMACVDAKDIPVSLLPPGPSKKKEADAIGMLDAYSFINKRSEDLSLDLHRLVHLATRNWLRKEDLLAKWTERAVARLKDVLPVDFHQADQCRSVWRRYLTHARYTLECNTIEKDDECKFELAWRLATCLHCDGRYAEAEVLYAESVESEKKMLGPEHKHTLASMGALALIISDRGRWKEAEELQTQVVEAEKRVLGPEHPNTLTNMSNLALTFWRQGRLEEAEKLGMQVLEINKRILGLEHPDTLSSMNSLAVTFSDQGRMKEAEDLYTQVIEIRKSVLGQEHIDALISMSNLALTFRRQRRLKEAEELGLQVLEISKRVLGREHPSTLTSMNNLAFTWNSCGRRTEALKLMEECVLLRSQALGPNHPHTLDSRELLLEWQTEELGTAASVDEDVDV